MRSVEGIAEIDDMPAEFPGTCARHMSLGLTPHLGVTPYPPKPDALALAALVVQSLEADSLI